MMYQKQSGRSAWLKYALALPVLFFLTVVFARHNGQKTFFKTYTTIDLSKDIVSSCDGMRCFASPAYFLENTIENQYLSGQKDDHYIISDFFKSINKSYDPNNQIGIFINEQRITSSSQLSIDFAKPWVAKHIELIRPDMSLTDYGIKQGVIKIVAPSNDISLYENYVNQIDGETLGSKYMYMRNSSPNIDAQNFDKLALIEDLTKIHKNEGSQLEDFQSAIQALIKKYLEGYPKEHHVIMTSLSKWGWENGFMIAGSFDQNELKRDPADRYPMKDINSLKVSVKPFNRYNLGFNYAGAEPLEIPTDQDIDVLFEHAAPHARPKESVLRRYLEFAYPLRNRADLRGILNEKFDDYVSSNDIDFGIEFSAINPIVQERIPDELLTKRSLTLADSEMPILWTQEWDNSQTLSDIINLDKPIKAVYYLSPEETTKIFGDRGQRGFYALMGYDRPRSHPMKQKEMMNFELENFFQTISQTDESSWVTKLKEVHHQLREKYPKITDWTTPFTTRAHAHDINLVIIDSEIIKAYKASGADYERLDKEVEKPAAIPAQNDKIYKVVDEMPRFPGCEEIGSNAKEKKACADQNLLQYLYDNLKYPKIAMDNGVEGRVYIQFVIDKDGSIENAKIVRDIGAGCGQAALEVVNRMNDMPDRWTPGKEDGQVVKVLYTLPVTFKINKDVPQDTVVIFDPENFSELMLIHPSDESAPEMRNEQSREYLVELIQSSFGSIISGSVSLYGTINPDGSIMWSIGSDGVGDSNRADFDEKSKEVIEKITKKNISMTSNSGSTSLPNDHKMILTVPIQ